MHSLTAVGSAYLQRCRRVLQDVRAAEEAIAAGSDARRCHPVSSAEYLRSYPKVKIESWS